MPRPQIHDDARVAAFVLGASRTRYLVMRQEDVWFITFNGEEFGPYRSEREAMLFATDAAHKLGELGRTPRSSGLMKTGRSSRFGPTVSTPILRRRSRGLFGSILASFGSDDRMPLRLYEEDMRTDLFDFELPPDRIALASRRAAGRGAATGRASGPVRPNWDDRGVRDLPGLLRPGDAIVVNDTKVIPARLRGRRIGRGAVEPTIEATLHQRLDGSRWRAFVKPAKRLSPGDMVRFGNEGKVCFLGQLDATVEAKGEGGEVTLAFAFHGPVLDQALDERGAMPLPPYIAARRAPDERDRARLSDHVRAAWRARSRRLPRDCTSPRRCVAPEARGITLHKVTLHVGAGTFLPVKAADTAGIACMPSRAA